MLKINNLNKRYENGVHAINDISLSIGKGMFGLLGPNGAGKSSFMRTLATLQQPDSGQIIFNGIDVLTQPEHLKQVLGYLPQEFGVYPRVSAFELLDYLAVLKGISNKKAREQQVCALLAQTNLYEHKDNNVNTFSGGMKRRFGIAQALLGDPKLIMVDEPTAGLDPEERNRFYNMLAEVGKDTVLILSTHIIEDIQELCSDMAIISKGKLIAQATPKQLIQSMENKVWCKPFMAPEELTLFSDKVLSTKSVGDKKLVYIYSDDNPGEDFEQVEPSLEDAYFHLLNAHAQQVLAGV